jgi:uncharacterized protein
MDLDLLTEPNVLSVEIPTHPGSLAGEVHLPVHLPAPVVVCCHGLLSSKDSSKYLAIGKNLSHAGLAVVRFDFSGCGESVAPLLDTLLNTRMRDLQATLDYVQKQPWTSGQLGLLGSSLGGYLALLAAARTDQVGAVVCWATPFDLDKVQKILTSAHTPPQLLSQGMEVGRPVNLSGLPAISRVLVVHGQRDKTVSWQEGLQLYRRLGEPKQLLLLEDGDHRLLDPAYRKLAIQASLDWFCRHLNSKAYPEEIPSHNAT